MEQPGKDNNTSTAVVPAPKEMGPQEVYMAMQKLGMKDELKQFEQDMTNLQASLMDQGNGVMGQYQQIQKKGTMMAAVSTAAGAIAGGLGGLFLSRNRQWGGIKKGATTLAGGIAGAGVLNFLAAMPMRKKMAQLQQDAAGLGDKQNSDAMQIVDKYRVMVQQRMGMDPMPVPPPPAEPKKPEEPTGEPSVPAVAAENSVPSGVLQNVSASQLVSPARRIS